MSVERAVMDANARFYEAFNRQDLILMQAVWQQGGSSSCIHPGWEVLKGFDDIIQSWEKIFTGSENLEIKISDIEVSGGDGMFWVSCQENLFAMSTSGVQLSKVHATNLFKNEGDHWKMVLHHASSVPQTISRQEQISSN
ncbi:MAG: nuclear transport factor 2 family protein [Nitrospinae bacterium]|jgi:ketosteroid isomerase-like protein|nr:nuclear transport factor 2 family protein [Nitrospinota bacterium]MDA1109779.1 nuclear transport factor 2 family protein [Nitrospinota bacterium]